MDQPSDQELWEQVRRGDAGSFTTVFERHGKAIYNFLFRRTGSWTLAEDLSSITFLEAWRKRSLVIESESILPWLFGVANNILRNHRRSLRRYQRALERVPLATDTEDHADEVAGRLDDARRMTDILRTFHRLPRPQREALSLCAWGGLSYEEAARALGIPVGTVRSRVSRARSTLRELSAGTGHEPDSDLRSDG